jgi:hypothetical protein
MKSKSVAKIDSLIVKVIQRIQDPRLTCSINKIWPRSQPLYPPTTHAIVNAAEKKLGFRLPILLREMYTRVGNGGFGPGYGIYGLEGGYLQTIHGSKCSSLVDIYLEAKPTGRPLSELGHDFTRDGSLSFGDNINEWPQKLVEICSLGDDMYYCIDCSSSAAPILLLIAYGGEFQIHCSSFEEWFENWLNND